MKVIKGFIPPEPGTMQWGDIKYAHGSLTMRVTLAEAIQWAYRIQTYQLLAPQWLTFSLRNDE